MRRRTAKKHIILPDPKFKDTEVTKFVNSLMVDGKKNIPYPEVLNSILESPKPIIAAVNGAAYAGGLGLIAASDIVVTDQAAQFSFSEVRIGVIPAVPLLIVL